MFWVLAITVIMVINMHVLHKNLGFFVLAIIVVMVINMNELHKNLDVFGFSHHRDHGH